MTEKVTLPYGDGELSFDIPAGNLLAVLSPRAAATAPDAAAEVRRALSNPVSAPPLAEAARGAKRVVILADDMTRQTPVRTIVPMLLDELAAGGVRSEQITVLIALGTHRPMTASEIEQRFGPDVVGRVRIVNHPWDDPSQLADLGATQRGTPIQVARLALEADLLIGLGNIVPHHIPGFSAGAKIVQPGICGAVTTGATHLLSARGEPCLGRVENPVRAEMEEIAARVGLSAVLNTVLDPAGRLVRAFYGDPRLAFRAGVGICRQVYGLQLPAQADIVIAGSHPCDIEFWQAHKTLYPADLAARPGGTLIIVTPCPEGVSVTHQAMLGFASHNSGDILAMIDQGAISDVVAGALAVAIAKVRERCRVSLVSTGITAEEARALGFTPFASVEEALADALRRHSEAATVNVLTHSPDTLPILR